ANELTTAPIETLSPAAPTELDPDEHTAASPQLSLVDHLRAAILNALSAAGHRMLVSILEVGQWRVEPNEVVIKVAASPTVIDMSLGADARRIAVATASGVLGRAVKLNLVSGGVSVKPTPAIRPTGNGSGRNRAEQDPIVRRMQEKFGAEIRTIIDYKDKR